MSLVRGEEVQIVDQTIPPTSTAVDEPTVSMHYFRPVRRAPEPTATTVTAEYQVKLMQLSCAPYGQLANLARYLNVEFTDNADLKSKIPQITEADCKHNGYAKLQNA